jgi:hypothetical protein
MPPAASNGAPAGTAAGAALAGTATRHTGPETGPEREAKRRFLAASRDRRKKLRVPSRWRRVARAAARCLTAGGLRAPARLISAAVLAAALPRPPQPLRAPPPAPARAAARARLPRCPAVARCRSAVAVAAFRLACASRPRPLRRSAGRGAKRWWPPRAAWPWPRPQRRRQRGARGRGEMQTRRRGETQQGHASRVCRCSSRHARSPRGPQPPHPARRGTWVSYGAKSRRVGPRSRAKKWLSPMRQSMQWRTRRIALLKAAADALSRRAGVGAVLPGAARAQPPQDGLGAHTGSDK